MSALLEQIVANNMETLDRIRNQVFGTIIVNNEGLTINTSFDNSTTQAYSTFVGTLTDRAKRAVRDIDPTDDLAFFRIKTKKNEILVAPRDEFTIYAVM